VLTSLSEAQPYIILEANMAGIPVVATDVGACREMIEGLGNEDKSIGTSGLVTSVSNPVETGEAILRLLSDDKLYKSCAENGKSRVRRYYDQDDLLSRYLNIYEQNL
jgi:glycosyltransferase involved in cell wall biosynthesis